MKKILIVLILGVTLSPFTAGRVYALDGGAGWLNVAKEYGLDTLFTIINTRIVDKLINDTVNWANGGFDGEPGFINNWDDYLKGTEQDVIVNAFNFASEMGGFEGAEGEDPGEQAQNNYNAWNSGELDSYRIASETIARFGGERFNIDPLKALIEGQGNTLNQILGTNSEVENFKNDFTLGGLESLILLADPKNFPWGQTSVLETTLGQQTAQKVETTVEDLQTPNKFLDRTWCTDRDEESGECNKELTGTPGALIESKVKEAANSDQERGIVARELSDLLAQALGKLTDSLLQSGFDKLTKSDAGSQVFQAASFFTGTYQNQFDILGLGNLSNPGGFGNTGGGSSTGGGGENPIFDPETGAFIPVRGTDGSLPYIGGPEDMEGTAWNEGPEIIIDLKSVLEKSTKLVEQELALLTETERILRSGKDNVMKLDRCIPGPKYGWEDRLRDNLNLNGDSDDEESILDKIGLQDTKRMANDSMMNIPGAMQMRGTVNALLNQTGNNPYEEVSNERNKKLTYLAILKNMRTNIQNDFNTYKTAVDSRLVLFEDDWELLSDADKIALFSIPQRDENGEIIYVPIESGGLSVMTIDGPQERPLYLMEEYYLFKPGETPESVFTNNPDAVKNAVLSFSWNLWQLKKGEEPATTDTPNGIIQKSNIRYQYYAMSKYLTTEADILEAEVKKDEVTQSNKTISDLLHDCVQLKSYVLGKTYEQVDGLLEFLQNAGLSSRAKIQALGFSMINCWASPEGRCLNILNVEGAKTDQEIKNYILQQKALQENNQESVFHTNVITSGVDESILGFETEEEKAQYFIDFYEREEDAEFISFGMGMLNDAESPEQNPVYRPKSVAEIYSFDYTTANWPRGGTATGILYCRVGTTFDARGKKNKQAVPKCFKDWYGTSSIEYNLALMNVQ